MGKKTKRTKWRTLEIPPPSGKNFENANNVKWEEGRRTPSANYHQYDKTGRRFSSSESPVVATTNLKYSSMKKETKIPIEDEYTKITTPRQDVLFKKGYLTRRKVPETISENSVDQNSDDIAQDCTNNEDVNNYGSGDDNVQQYMCPAPQSYIDPSALYYGGGYEIYDPYMGNLTVVVSPPAGQYPSNSSCQPILTSVPCRPVPLQPVQWFNPVPSSDWCCSFSPQSDKRYSTESQNGSGLNSESSGVPESPLEMIEEQLGNSSPVFPPSYVYPGYMFGAPIYNMDGVNVQYYAPQSPALSGNEQTASKRRKKRKRRRRTGEVEEESESSVDDNCSRSISSNECILDFQSQTESLEYEDELKNQTSYTPTTARYPSLPHGVVNAPEFVPSELSLPSTACNQNNCLLTDNVSSAPFVSSRHNDESDPPQTEKNISKKSAGLNVYCKPFNNRESKHDLERVSSSNNSDSGISSPGSEDTSKGDFRGTETKIERCEEGVKKKPRSRKSNKAKNRVEQDKIVESIHSSKKLNQKTGKATPNRNQSKKEKSTKEEELERVTKLVYGGNGGRGKKANKNETVISQKNKAPKKETKIIENFKKGSTVLGEHSKKVEQLKRRVSEGKLETCVEKLKSINVNDDVKQIEKSTKKSKNIVNERGEKGQTLKSNEFSRCDGCVLNICHSDIEDERCLKACVQEVEDIVEKIDCTVNTDSDQSFQAVLKEPARSSSQETTNECQSLAEKETPPTMLNEYVQIEKEPVLAKLVQLDELTDEPVEGILKQISISHFSSCRENEPVKPPPRRKKLSRKSVESTAQQIVDEIIERAEQRVLSSVTCDKLQLPITQAVTKWLNEHGGLPAVIEDSLHNSQYKSDLLDDDLPSEGEDDDDDDDDDGVVVVAKFDKTKSKKSKPNCVIC